MLKGYQQHSGKIAHTEKLFANVHFFPFIVFVQNLQTNNSKIQNLLRFFRLIEELRVVFVCQL